ncbi:MAG: hypothetical protein WEB33_03250 [Bacteroidota bacterium]
MNAEELRVVAELKEWRLDFELTNQRNNAWDESTTETKQRINDWYEATTLNL